MFEETSQIVQDAEGAMRGEQRKIMGKENGKESLEEFIRRIEGVSAGYDDDEMELVPQGVRGEERQEYRDFGLGFPYLGAGDTRMSGQAW
jgi:hypothetical protein